MSTPIQVILYKSLRGKGKPGDIISVAKGFANVLIPKKLADFATKEKIDEMNKNKAKHEAEDLKNLQNAQELKGKLEGLKLDFFCKLKDGNNIYGSIQAREIEQKLHEYGFKISKSNIRIARPIKALGVYDVNLELYGDVAITISANVRSITVQSGLK